MLNAAEIQNFASYFQWSLRN